MLKKMLTAVIIAVLTAAGIVIPSRYIDSFVSLFMPRAEASTMAAFDTSLRQSKYDCHRGCHAAGPIRVASTVEALRPSSEHFSSDRVVSGGVIYNHDHRH